MTDQAWLSGECIHSITHCEQTGQSKMYEMNEKVGGLTLEGERTGKGELWGGAGWHPLPLLPLDLVDESEAGIAGVQIIRLAPCLKLWGGRRDDCQRRLVH